METKKYPANLESVRPQNRLVMTEKVKSRQELAEEYGISAKTFSRWLKKENIEVAPGLLTIKEQELIYTTFGRPLSKKQ